MFKFRIPKAVRDVINSIKDFTQKETSSSNETIDKDKESTAENYLKIHPDATLADFKYVTSLPEEHALLLYKKNEEEPSKRSFEFAFSEDDAREDFNKIVKRVKLSCAFEAATALIKHNIEDSIICEALQVDKEVLDSLKEANRPESSDIPPLAKMVQECTDVLKESNKNIIKDCSVTLERAVLIKKEKEDSPSKEITRRSLRKSTIKGCKCCKNYVVNTLRL